MKKLIIGLGVALSLTACCNAQAEDKAGLGTFSEGYRIGEITKFSVKGMFTKSGEGQMLMGRESTPYIIRYDCGDGETCKKTINPWYFSSTPAKKSFISPIAG